MIEGEASSLALEESGSPIGGNVNCGAQADRSSRVHPRLLMATGQVRLGTFAETNFPSRTSPRGSVDTVLETFGESNTRGKHW